MIRTLKSFLIVALVLTGLALGAARGQARIAGEIVLCTGGAVTIISVDANGKPAQRAHFCPDMALALMAAVVAYPPVIIAPTTLHQAEFPGARAIPPGQPAPAMRARDPPLLRIL